MPSEPLQDAINEQIRHELYAAYLYLAMSAWCAEKNLTGFAHWMRMQSQEEVGHALRLVNFLIDRNGHVEFHALDAPPADFGSPLAVMERALEHEREVTGMIHRLYEIASEDGDYPAQVHLEWFITEQVEEESSIDEIVQRMKLFGTEGASLLVLDQQLGARATAE